MVERIHSFGWAVVVFLSAALFLLHGSHPVATMPTSADINGERWVISVVDSIDPSDPNTVGMTDCAIRHIYISRKSQRKQTTFMHEATHAAVCTNSVTDFIPDNMYYNSKSNGGHEGIYKFTEIWAEILARNPQLGAWLGEKE